MAEKSAGGINPIPPDRSSVDRAASPLPGRSSVDRPSASQPGRSSASQEGRAHTIPTPTMLVFIVRGESRDSDPHVKLLKACFTKEAGFKVKISQLPESDVVTNECHTLASVFQYIANSRYSRLPSLIIKDSSLIMFPAAVVHERINIMLQAANKTDLYYLCIWNDKCNRQTRVTELPDDPEFKLRASLHPTATQAIIYTPRAREIVAAELVKLPRKTSDLGQVLNGLIASRPTILTSAIVDPNIVDFDLSLAVTNRDYEKRNRCLATPILVDDVGTDSTTGLFILIVLVIVIIIIAYVVFTRVWRRRAAVNPNAPREAMRNQAAGLYEVDNY